MQSSPKPEEPARAASRAPAVPVVVGVASIELFAIALWAGGLVALGAVAAPVVFGTIPMPGAADAMTMVFRRFDTVAMTCAAIALVCEATFVVKGGRVGRPDVFRGASVTLAAALAIGEGVWLSPAIDALHRRGAVRGLGEAGMALERTHRLAESAGKGQLLLLLVAIVLVVVKVARASSSNVKADV
jgi:hypothetical protein